MDELNKKSKQSEPKQTFDTKKFILVIKITMIILVIGTFMLNILFYDAISTAIMETILEKKGFEVTQASTAEAEISTDEELEVVIEEITEEVQDPQ